MRGGEGDPTNHERRIERLEGENARLWEKVSSLQRFQAWVTGVAVGAAAALGLFIDYIKKHLGL